MALLWPSGSISVSKEFLITGNSIGLVQLGQTKQQIFRSYKNYTVRQVDLLLEGLPSPALQIFRGKELLLTAEFEKATVYRISTRNPKYATARGIRVGSSFGEAKRRLGEPVSIGQGEDGVYAVVALKSGELSLRLAADSSTMLPASKTKIVEILVIRR